jgi:hypothetical protein
VLILFNNWLLGYRSPFIGERIDSMKLHAILTTAAVALSTVAFSSAASANGVSVPDATAIAGGFSSYNGVSSLGSSTPPSQAMESDATGWASGQVYSGIPAVSANAATTSNPSNPTAYTPLAIHGGSAQEVYYFSLNGPSSNNIPLTLSGYASTSVSGYGVAWAYIALDGLGISDCSGCSNSASPGGNFVIQPYGHTGINTIRMEAGASVSTILYEGVIGLGSATAFIDPYLQIDPSFLSTHPGYSLTFSPGIINAPLATPLPGSLPMFVALIAGMCGFARFRKQRQGFAVAA